MKFILAFIAGFMLYTIASASEFTDRIAALEAVANKPMVRAEETCDCTSVSDCTCTPGQCTCARCTVAASDKLTYWREANGCTYEYRGATWTGVAWDAEDRKWINGVLAARSVPVFQGVACSS